MSPPGTRSIAPDHVPQIRPGMSPDELARSLSGHTYWRFEARTARTNRSIYRARARYEPTLVHQFTRLDPESREILCVRSQIIVPSFLFLFVDGSLKHVWHEYGMAAVANPSLAADAILANEPITPDQIASIIHREVDRENQVRQYMEPPPVPLILMGKDPALRRLRAQARLLRQYDAFNLELGISPAEAAAVVGEPDSLREDNPRRLVSVCRGTSDDTDCELVLSLVFEDNRLQAVYTQLLPTSLDWTPNPYGT